MYLNFLFFSLFSRIYIFRFSWVCILVYNIVLICTIYYSQTIQLTNFKKSHSIIVKTFSLIRRIVLLCFRLLNYLFKFPTNFLGCFSFLLTFLKTSLLAKLHTVSITIFLSKIFSIIFAIISLMCS